MVGRGWWVLVWTVCAAWTVCVVCGGLSCQPGQEFFSSQQGQCVPCTRCHDPLVVVVPCYVYRDAECAPAAQFVRNWSQPSRHHTPITLSTPSTPHAREDHVHDRRTTNVSSASDKLLDKPEKLPGSQEKSHASKSPSKKQNIGDKSDAALQAQDGSEKNSKEHPRHHHHRHNKKHSHSPQTQSDVVAAEESKVNRIIINNKNGANSTVDKRLSNSNKNVASGNDSDIESNSKDISDGSVSDDAIQENDSEEPEAASWKEKIFFAAIIVVSICLVVLIIVTLSHLRNILARRKLKRVYDGVSAESSGEMRVMEQLLPTASEGASPSRGVVTYIRATTITTPSSPIITTSAAMSVESQRISGHVYPVNPFTMDRLLEQRRVLGPASSVDTNLYIESWQQQDSQPAGHTAPATPGQCALARGSVSACPSPAPIRTYRSGPASASASPTVSVRGLSVNRGRVRGIFTPPMCAVSGGGGGGCS